MPLEKSVTVVVLGILLIFSLSFVSWPTRDRCQDNKSCQKFGSVVTRRAVSFQVNETSVSNLAYSTRYSTRYAHSCRNTVFNCNGRLLWLCYNYLLTRVRRKLLMSVTAGMHSI